MKRVLLLIETSRSYGRECLLGIAAYLRSHGAWDLTHVERGLTDEVPPAIRARALDGIIARIETRSIAEQVLAFGVPIVDTRAHLRIPGVAQVTTDACSCAEEVHRHLRDRGFRRFAYCGYPGVDFSEQRRAAFRDLVGDELLVYDQQQDAPAAAVLAREESGELEVPELASWLATLPTPIGVFACNDVRGRQVLRAARRAAIEVPTDLAVVGVDDDPVLCELAAPPLSSVSPDAREVGFAAAQLLDQLMDGAPAPDAPRLVRVRGVVARRSSDVMAIDDSVVLAALAMIRERAGAPLRVRDIVRASGVSRATLSRRFQAQVGHGIKQEVDRARVAKATQLLQDTTYDLARIARLAGFGSPSHLSVAFKRVSGERPSDLRDRIRSRTLR
jgi:LacI family transcriptional regulator